MHIRAAAHQIGFTPSLREQAAAHLVRSGQIRLDAASGICTCSRLADVTKAVHFRPAEGFCTCYDRAMNGVCCHLLAGIQLHAFHGIELPWTVRLAHGEGETVSGIKRQLVAAALKKAMCVCVCVCGGGGGGAGRAHGQLNEQQTRDNHGVCIHEQHATPSKMCADH